MDPFLRLNINQTLDRLITESHESYMQRMAVLKAVALWDEIKCRERGAVSSEAEARTRVRLILDATTKATLVECSEDDDADYEDEVDDSVSVDTPVFYG